MRYLLGSLLLVLALGAIRVAGCGDGSPCGDCDDGNPCTIDSCKSHDSSEGCDAGHWCAHLPAADGTACGSGEVCVEGMCGENLCEGVVCEEDDMCTDDRCDYVDGLCKFPPTVCDDGDSCTVDRCIPTDGCDFTTLAEDGSYCISEDIQPVNLGLCEDGVCVAPCDATSADVTQCPVEGRGDLFCCPGEEACASGCN